MVTFSVRLWKLAQWVHICWTPTLLSSYSPLTNTSCSIAHWMFLLWSGETLPPLTSYLSWISVKYFICLRFCHLSLNQLMTENNDLLEYMVCVFSVSEDYSGGRLSLNDGHVMLWYFPLTLKPLFGFCHYPVIFGKSVYVEYLTVTLLTPVTGGKSQFMLFSVHSPETDDASTWC